LFCASTDESCASPLVLGLSVEGAHEFTKKMKDSLESFKTLHSDLDEGQFAVFRDVTDGILSDKTKKLEDPEMQR
jgi:hypothetical protein